MNATCAILRRPIAARIASLLALLAGAIAAAPAALAQGQAFEQGATSASIMIGAGRQLNRDYTVLGARYGTYFIREFEGSLTLEAWRGNDPSIFKVTPELRYVYARRLSMKPYLGLFLSRSFYDSLPDRNSYGAKAGVYFTLNPNAHLGIGIVHERIEACSRATYGACTNTFPELALHFTF